jgi:hypothetical protein
MRLFVEIPTERFLFYFNDRIAVYTMMVIFRCSNTLIVMGCYMRQQHRQCETLLSTTMLSSKYCESLRYQNPTKQRNIFMLHLFPLFARN